ncbi:MAG: ComF family protein [Phycisphaeraceae bacterium]|nr:ComF family protein [Phycisphaeraceae bacterium]
MNVATTIRGWTEQAGALLDRVWPTVVSTELDAAGGWQPDQADDYCQRCGASAGPGSVLPDGCTFCRGRQLYWDRLTRLSLYDEPMDGWIKQMKFAKQWSWAPHFGRLLAERVGEPIEEGKIVVAYVPMHWRRRWRRGFNQAELMAKALAKARGWPIVPLIKRTDWTPPQPSVIASQREANVKQSFALREVDLEGWQVLLIDDIKTSGATLGACCRLMKGAGARSIQVAVAAVADPKGTKFKKKL